MIVEEQGGSSKTKYGNKLIVELSKQMTFDFGKGFDERNLRYMRKFYLSFPNWNTVCSELSWSHYHTSKGYIATSKSAKKIAMYKAKQSLVKKTILQGTGGYALFTTNQNFTSWGLNQLLGW